MQLDLYQKLDELEQFNKLKKQEKRNEMNNIISNIILEKSIRLKKYRYKSEKEYSLFQRDINFEYISNLFCDKYDIIYDEDDERFNIVEEIFTSNSYIISYFINMYIIVDKNDKEKCFCLFVKRSAQKCNFKIKKDKVEEAGTFFTGLYSESKISICISDCNFNFPLYYRTQIKNVNNKIEKLIDIENFKYYDVMTEYIKSNYLSKEYICKVSPTCDYFNYIKQKSNLNKDDYSRFIPEILSKIYSKLNNSNNQFEEMTTVIDKYTIKVSASKILKNRRATVYDENKSNGKICGYANVDVETISCAIEIYTENKLVKVELYELGEKKELKCKFENIFARELVII